VELPGPQAGRASTVIEQEGAPVAVLVHDEALLEVQLGAQPLVVRRQPDPGDDRTD